MPKEKYKKFICKILCNGIDEGTGFLIDKNLVMTAAHVTEGASNEISVQFLELGKTVLEIPCKIREEKSDLDVEILELDKSVNINENIQLNTNTVSIGSNWISFGYPAESSPQIAMVGGIVNNANDGFNPCDFNIDLEVHSGILGNYKGLSGAPLIIGEKFHGIITHQNGLKLKAIEFNRFKDYIESLNLEYILNDSNNNISNIEIPHTDVIEDFSSIEKLDDLISEQIGGRILIAGSVGIGKSTFVQYYTASESIVTLGKYFIKVPNDPMPISYRISDDVFCEWFEMKVFDYLGIRRESTEKLSYSKRIENLSSLFLELSKRLQDENKKAVFFIDGIDELLNYSQSEIQRFLSFIPTSDPKNIFFVITSNNYHLLPSYFLQTIDLDKNIIELQLHCKEQTQYFLFRALKKSVTNIQLEVLAQKSMGHPLYLSYIINYINSATGSGDTLDEFIEDLPVYGGSIKPYYDFLWSRISQNTYQLHWVSYLARIRSTVEAQTFRSILPNEIKIHFENALNQLRYLLMKGDRLAFFHNSFSDYVVNTTEYMQKEVHHQIGIYCLENKESDFSITNILFHLSNGNEDDITKSINECNQNWVDKCTIQDITPDLMIQDAKRILQLACITGDYVSVIRLLLLLQRIEFRFNQMFFSAAFEIAKAEISLNRADKAMHYIIRQGVLLLSIEETLYCLEMLVDKEFLKQAKEIIIKLESIFIYSIEQGQGIPYEFISHILQAYQMYSKFDRSYSMHKTKTILKMLEANLEKSDKSERAMNDIVGSAHSYFLWKFNVYMNLDKAQEIGMEANQNISDLFIQMLICARDKEEQYHKKYVSDYHNIVNDIEQLIQIASTTNKYKAVEVLIEESKNYELVKDLISECKDYKAYETIRAENGVDVSWRNFNWTFSYYRNQAYLLLMNPESVELSNNLFKNDWEKGLSNLLQFVATLYGRALYCRVVNDYSKMENDITGLIYKIEYELFSFDDRTVWNRSYHIPEKILPALFKYITKYIAQCKTEKLQEYLNIVKMKAKDQFGIYSEGYFELLFEIVYTLMTNEINSAEIQSIVDLLYEDIKAKVLNRWERTPMLLQLVEIYSVLGCDEKSNEVYSEMLKTSMGPTWYKEAQLSLLSQCFNPINTEKITMELIRRNFVLLDTASGGMTFERFVRVAKEELIGELWNKEFYDIAIKFLKVQLYPDIQSLNFNIGAEPVDVNQYGLRNNRIANSIFLDSAIVNILGQDKSINKCIVWTLSEIFMFGDERYLSGFIRIQSEILNSLHEISSSNLKSYVDRTISILVCDCDEKRLYNFLSSYKKYVHKEIFDNIIKKVSAILNIKIENLSAEMDNAISKFTDDRNIPKVEKDDLEKEQEDFFLEGTFGKFSALDSARKDILLAQEEKSKGNIVKAKDCYVKGLSNIHYGGWDIWQNSPVEEATECFDSIKMLCKTPVETVKQLEEIITNENYCNNWEIAYSLYNLISGMCSNNEQQQITDEILKHLETIVKPSEKYIAKYSDIANENYLGNPDEALLDLILWLAWYQDSFVSQKVFEILPWIIKENPYYLTKILNNCFDEDINKAELCVTICLNSSDTQNPSLWELINNYDTLGKVINSKFFIVKSTFLQIYLNFLNVHPEVTSFIDTIQHYFELPTIVAGEETIVDYSVTEMIKKINRESIFDGLKLHVNNVTKIRLDVLTAIEKKNSPKTILQLYNLDFALCKSFYRNSMHLGYLDTMLFENINEILCSYISPEKSEGTANVIRRLNPFFPVQKLESYNGFEKAGKLKKILYEDNPDPFEIQESISDDTHTMLYYQNYEYRNKEFSHIELIAYIIPKHFEIQDYFTEVIHRQEYHYSNEYFRASELVSENVIRPVEAIIPNIVQGRPISPSFPSNAFKQLISVDDTAFRNDLWLSGRLWNDNLKGFPLNEGCSVKISTELLSSIQSSKKIIYKLSDDVETVIIDTYKRSITKIGGIE